MSEEPHINFFYPSFHGIDISSMPIFKGFTYNDLLFELDNNTAYLSNLIKTLEPDTTVIISPHFDLESINKSFDFIKLYSKFQFMISQTNSNSFIYSQYEFFKIIRNLNSLKTSLIHNEFYDWLQVQDFLPYEKQFLDFNSNISNINSITEFILSTLKRSEKISSVLFNQNLPLADWIISFYKFIPDFNSKMELISARCIKYGKLISIQWLFNNNYLFPMDFHLELASTYGNLECLDWLLSLNGSFHNEKQIKFNFHYAHNRCFKETIINGHTHCAKLLFSMDTIGFSNPELLKFCFYEACSNKNVDLVDWIFNLNPFDLLENNFQIPYLILKTYDIPLCYWLFSKIHFDFWIDEGKFFKDILKKNKLDFAKFLISIFPIPPPIKSLINSSSFSPIIHAWLISI